MKLFVPGRICLFGEHSDWAGGYRRMNAEIEKGYTLICGTDQGILRGCGTAPYFAGNDLHHAGRHADRPV